MARRPVIAFQELFAPPGKQVKCPLAAASFIAEIVGPAAICVNRVKRAEQTARQQQRCDAKVFVVRVGEAAAIRLGGLQGRRPAGPIRTVKCQVSGKAVVHQWIVSSNHNVSPRASESIMGPSLALLPRG